MNQSLPAFIRHRLASWRRFGTKRAHEWPRNGGAGQRTSLRRLHRHGHVMIVLDGFGVRWVDSNGCTLGTGWAECGEDGQPEPSGDTQLQQNSSLDPAMGADAVR